MVLIFSEVDRLQVGAVIIEKQYLVQI